MITTRLPFIFLCSIFILLPRHQALACQDSHIALNNTELQTGSFNSDDCFLSLVPLNNVGLVYRDFLFMSDSSLMVFNSFGAGPESTTTGAREFMFFPRKQSLSYTTVDGGLLRIELSDIHFVMDSKNSRFTTIEGIEFSLAQSIDPSNKGGLEILSSQKLFLDLGFKLGNAPRVQQDRKVYFQDKYAATCELLNSDIFDYTADKYNPKFKFPSDQELGQFLKLRCANLDISSIL